MTDRPDFDELVGEELEPAERERLLRVHRALLEAGPPPELSDTLTSAPSPDVVPFPSRRRRAALVALAAAFAAVAFAIGYVVADDGGPRPERVGALA